MLSLSQKGGTPQPAAEALLYSGIPDVKIKVLFFAGLRERAGTNSTVIDLPAGATVAAAIEQAQSKTPRAWRATTRLMAAVNQEYVPTTHQLREGDELALIPPVSGGAVEARSDVIVITEEPLDPKRFADAVRADANGAVVTFEGVTRDHNEGRKVRYLEYEAYRPMADQKIAELFREMKGRWPIDQVAVGHRVGRVDIGETSMVVAVSAAHRRPAFEAALYFVDRLKEVVPIWKKEYFEGGETWIADSETESTDPSLR
ncbi:MAG: molybdopterin converting factor subunit 1 [Chloroflexi bacterium]|nr:molybdopterin converting factor subunit 1 [Chloroflexota bacterium]